MSIQSTVNQGISLLGFMIGQTPMAAAQREKAVEAERTRKVKQDLARAGESTEASLSSLETVLDTSKSEGEKRTAEDLFSEQLKREIDIQTELFEREPTVERAQSLIHARTASRDYDETLAEDRQENPTARATREAQSALAAEQNRLAASNEITRSLDISNIDERALPRLERAYKRAQRDTRYLAKGEKSED